MVSRDLLSLSPCVRLRSQLKSQKFLGHTLGFGRARPRGELYIDIPEEEVSAGAGRTSAPAGVQSPTSTDSIKQDSGCEIEDTVIVGGVRPGGKREVRTIGVGPEELRGSSQVGVGVQRSEERRVGKECLRLCRSRWSPYH